MNVKTAGPGNVGMFANSGVSSVVWPSLSCLDLRTNAYAYPNVYYFTIFYSREYNPTDVYFPVLQSVMLSSGKEAEIVV